MRSMNRWFEVLVVGVSAFGAACSSGNGTDNTGGTTPEFNIGPGTGGNLPSAESTPDGLLGISTSQATTLTTSECAGWQAVPQGDGNAILQFVIDVSGSMSNDDADPNNPAAGSKWDVFSATLPGIYSALPSTFAVGALYYSAQTNQCYAANRADVGIAAMNQTQVNALTSSVNRVQVGGSTPTYQAWLAGLENISRWAPGPNDPPALAAAGKYIVLITDGVPTVGRNDGRCAMNRSGIPLSEYEDELSLIDQQTSASGVRTFVVGVVGSNNPQGATFDPLYMLSRVAVAGQTTNPSCTPVSGTPTNDDVNPRGNYCHYDLSTSSNLGTDLANALGGIASSVLSCNYAVGAPPAGKTVDPSMTTLVFTDGATGGSSIVLQNTSTTCDKGWHFTDSTNSQIEICGVTCAALQANPSSALNLVFGCDAGKIIN